MGFNQDNHAQDFLNEYRTEVKDEQIKNLYDYIVSDNYQEYIAFSMAVQICTTWDIAPNELKEILLEMMWVNS